jgi:methenyltetrahydromethanopterin cyclohydrolase
VVDCGAAVPGGLRAGALLARACLADLAEVGLIDGDVDGVATPHVQVMTDHPVAACLGSQYAGWPVSVGKFFAMGSGPMRAARGKEPMLEHIGMTLDEGVGVVKAVGVLECRKPPGPEVVEAIAAECDVLPAELILLFAPTASLAGGVQVVARSVETALHKLAELKFDLSRIRSAHGTAPLPPVAANDMAAIGRTNDAVLYGARVVLYVTGDDESLAEIGPRVPSSSSRDHGEPFAAIFARYNHDFYAVDPLLFSPAEVVFQNLQTGRSHAFGRLEPEVLARSFWG